MGIYKVEDELKHAKVGVNEAGPGVTIGDWQVGVIPVTGTDSRYDLAQERERAERQEENAREEKQLGQKLPDPVGDLVRTELAGPPPLRPVDPLVAQIQDAIAQKKKPADPTGNT